MSSYNGHWWLVFLAAAFALPVCASQPATADELDSVFDQLLSNPDDPALNIRYAELVEARGETRKALAAYERALARNPTNRKLRRAYRRTKRRLQPSVTEWTLKTGVSWASNPRQLPASDARHESDATFDLDLLLFDERTVAGHRWRSLGRVSTQIQNDVGDLTDAVTSFSTGPVFELGEHSRLHVAPGIAVAWLDEDWLYHDAQVKLTFETLYRGATQSITASIAHRETNSDFLGEDGVIAQVSGRFATYDKLRQGDAFYFLPRLRYSEPGGAGPDRIFSSPLFPGDYVEAGGRSVYYTPVARGRAIVGAGLGVYHRSYDQNVAFQTNDREDWLLQPTAHLIFPKIKGTKFDLRVDYRYENNDSNDRFEDFDNHVIGARTVRRF